MSNIWPSADLFELMESLQIIEMRGESFRLSQRFKEFVKELDPQKLNSCIEIMIQRGFLPEPETEDVHRVYFYMALVALWDPSLPTDEHETASIFLSAMSRARAR